MKDSNKKLTARMMAFVLIFALVVNIFPQIASAEAYNPKTDYENMELRFWEDKEPDVGFYINAASRYIIETVPEPEMGSTFGEWSVMDLLRGMYTGYDYINHIPDNYFEDYLKRIEKDVTDKNGNLHGAKSTEWSRLMLTLTSLGYDITDVASYDFIEKLSKSHRFSRRQGINGPIWEIIAMNTGGYKFYEQPDNKDVNTFGKMINFILEKEITQENGKVGGWSLFGDFPDVDITGMALQALAPYYLDESKYNEVREEDSPSYEEFAKAVERGIYTLSELQIENGGYNAWGSINSESTVQAIVALTALNIDPLSEEVNLPHIGKKCGFIKSGSVRDGIYTDNMIDALLTFWAKGSGSSPEVGGFKHVTAGNDGGGGAGTGVNAMATDQALYGLIAYDRYKKGEKPLYDMTDMKNGEYRHMLSDEYRESKAHNVTYVLEEETRTEKMSPYAAIKLPKGASTDEKIFKNWNTKADGSGTTYKAGELLSMPEHEITLYAQYRNKGEFPAIKEIKPVNDILVDIGTTEEEAKEQLSKITKIIDFENEEHEVGLTWNIESYNGNEIGNYTAIGTFELPQGVKQTDPPTELKVETTVKVSKQIPESELEFDEDTNTITGYKGKDRDVVIPKEIRGVPVQTIGEEAFKEKNLNTIYIPNSVMAIGREAFAGNELVEVNIPNSTMYIKSGAFRDNKLSKINISKNVLKIESNAFRNNNLIKVNIPTGIVNIGHSAFRENQLSRVNIPDSVLQLGDYAFSQNKLIEVNIPKGINKVGSGLFYENQLATIDIPNGITDIGVSAFAENNLTEVDIIDSVVSIGNGAFSSNELKTLKISEKATDIGENAFKDNKLSEVYIPNSVKNIKDNAFANNNILKGNARIDNNKVNVNIKENAFDYNGEDGKTKITPVFLRDEVENLAINKVEVLKENSVIAEGEINGNEIIIQLPKGFPESEVEKIDLGSYTLKILATEEANIKQENGASGDWSTGKINTVGIDSPTRFTIEKYGLEKEYILTIKAPEVEIVTITGVEQIEDVEVNFGTNKGEVLKKLPAKVILNLSNNSQKEVNVTWTSEEYDENKVGEYTFIGSYDLPKGVTGEKLEVSVKIIVKEEPAPEVDKAKLEEIINLAEKIDTDGKAEEDIKALEEAILAGKEILAKEEVTQEEVDNAVKAIKTAISNLEDKEEPVPEVDKSKLEEILNSAESLEIEDKTEKSVKALEEAIAIGKEIFVKEEVTQEEVDSAVEAIKTAISNLEDKEEPKPEVDKTRLEEILNSAKKISIKGKTEESVKALNKAILAGKEVLNKEEVTQEEIDSAVEAIKYAINSLKDKEEPIKPTEPTEPQEPNDKDLEKPINPTKPQKPNKPGTIDKGDNKPIKPNVEDKPAKTSLPKTGQSSMLWLSILGIILLVVGAKLWIDKRKEKEA